MKRRGQKSIQQKAVQTKLNFESVGDKMPNCEPAADRGLWVLSDPRLSNPAKMRKKCCYDQKNLGSICISLSPSPTHLSHTTYINRFENKVWEIYFHKEVCSFVHWSSSLLLTLFPLIYLYVLWLWLWVYNTCILGGMCLLPCWLFIPFGVWRNFWRCVRGWKKSNRKSRTGKKKIAECIHFRGVDCWKSKCKREWESAVSVSENVKKNEFLEDESIYRQSLSCGRLQMRGTKSKLQT